MKTEGGVKTYDDVKTEGQVRTEGEVTGTKERSESKSWGAVMGAYCAPYSSGKVYSFPPSLDNKESLFQLAQGSLLGFGP